MPALKKLLLTTTVLAVSAFSASATLIISAVNTPFTQDFDSLAQSGAANAQSGGIFASTAGWSFLETGTSGNVDQLYSGGTGSSTTGDTYSFGVAGTNAVTDRAFGMLQTGTLTSYLGLQFTNNTGVTLTSLGVAFRGETWRIATAADTLAFFYQAGTPALDATGYTAVPALNYTSVAGTAGIADGNAPGNFTPLSTTISGLSIANGATFTFRWADATGTSSAGMGIDGFSVTGNPVPEPSAAVMLLSGFGLMGMLRRRLPKAA